MPYNGLAQLTIKGDIFRIFEDPLSMIDSKGNILVYAGDAYVSMPYNGLAQLLSKHGNNPELLEAQAVISLNAL